MIADLRRFVELETPSTDKSLLDGFAEFLAGYAETTTGGLAEVLENEAGGNHVRVRCGGDEPPIMLLGHFDTVWPAGTIETMPFSVRDGIASGPGVFDMKCGLVQGF
jgi:glutamate carboxypeptidase